MSNPISAAICNATQSPALVAFLTAGYPSKEQFAIDLVETSQYADVVEIGVPFSDPMADGVTIQQASKTALDNGVSLGWIFEVLDSVGNALQAPILLMSYLNPLLAYGFDTLASASKTNGVSGYIVPDLPLEESHDLASALTEQDIALVQLVTPVTPDQRMQRLCEHSGGFVYAVTMTGITGGPIDQDQQLVDYLDRVRSASEVPVCAGFGISSAADVQRLCGHVDGVIVGTALIKAIERGRRPKDFLLELRKSG